jgi:predicted nuclease of predicted toxin-antitoxin system
MRIKLDENVTTRVVPALNALGHNVHTVQSEGLTGRSDEDIWLAAQAEQRFLITQDFGFADIRRFSPGTHFGILLLRLRITNQAAILKRLLEVFVNEDSSIWSRCLVIVTETKVRVVREQ